MRTTTTRSTVSRVPHAATEAFGFRARQLEDGIRRRVVAAASNRAGIERLAREACASNEATDSPIFVLGAGWRTGSTLLQRMLNSVPGTLIWGEPYSEGAILQHLVESLAFLDPRRGRFHGRELPDDGQLPSNDVWTANLTPPLHHLVAGQRAMLDRLFKEPAKQHGCGRWGIKEVVWGRDVIDLLELLYPGSRMVLLVRDPLSQWRSYRPKTRRPWYYRWPTEPIGTPLSFGRLWDRLVREFISAAQEIPQATLVRYEDLHQQKELERLGSFLGMEEPLRNDGPVVGSSRDRAFFKESIPRWERAVIRRTTRESAARVGYG